MKTSRFQLLACAALAAIFAGGVVVAQDTKSSDKSFLTDSAKGSLAEITMAKLALQKSKDPNVREFATRMIKDHQQLITDMKPLAKQMGLKEPTGMPMEAHATYLELKTKSGTDFDRAYVEAMVKDHHKDLQEFMDEQNKTSNPDLKAAVAKGEAVIKEHTMMIDKIAHMGGIQTPPMPTGS